MIYDHIIHLKARIYLATDFISVPYQKAYVHTDMYM